MKAQRFDIRIRMMAEICLLLIAGSTYGAIIPYYRMDSRALQSDAICYCDELKVDYEVIHHPASENQSHYAWDDTLTHVKCKILQVLKGNLKPGDLLDVTYGGIYIRHWMGHDEVTGPGSSFPYQVKVPAGRTLLFLTRDGNGNYSPIDAKLVQPNVVLRFGQFDGNPGPLVLSEQGPENFPPTKGKPYGEKELLEDAAIAVKNSARMKVPIRDPAGSDPYDPSNWSSGKEYLLEESPNHAWSVWVVRDDHYNPRFEIRHKNWRAPLLSQAVCEAMSAYDPSLQDEWVCWTANSRFVVLLVPDKNGADSLYAFDVASGRPVPVAPPDFLSAIVKKLHAPKNAIHWDMLSLDNDDPPMKVTGMVYIPRKFSDPEGDADTVEYTFYCSFTRDGKMVINKISHE